jgi:hypothetical protein
MGDSAAAVADMRKGAELEAADEHGAYRVGQSLERVQGRARLELERYRAVVRAEARQRRLRQEALRYEQFRRDERQMLGTAPLGPPPAPLGAGVVPAAAAGPGAPPAPGPAVPVPPQEEPAAEGAAEPPADGLFDEPADKQPAEKPAADKPAAEKPAEAPAKEGEADLFGDDAAKDEAMPAEEPEKPADDPFTDETPQ